MCLKKQKKGHLKQGGFFMPGHIAVLRLVRRIYLILNYAGYTSVNQYNKPI